MVNLTRIYTRTGDHGTTRLVDNSVADKTDTRVEAYGTTDELNSVLGLALACGLPEPVAGVIGLVQNELFDLGADLADPVDPAAAGPRLRIEAAQVERLERWCDEFGDGLPNLRSFLLPGGSVAGGHLHVARTVCRRAERVAWRAVAEHGAEGPGSVNP
ncbi:MAG: cob(I)yrinic acid a,c-diamide adenosyltransferase, partial [Propionibacteriaceae bacterium]|nr:cob(I)yrinic acid a,c-diamide adenosyltransferase [Propionibacteriaceae bacterium]